MPDSPAERSKLYPEIAPFVSNNFITMLTLVALSLNSNCETYPSACFWNASSLKSVVNIEIDSLKAA